MIISRTPAVSHFPRLERLLVRTAIVLGAVLVFGVIFVTFAGWWARL